MPPKIRTPDFPKIEQCAELTRRLLDNKLLAEKLILVGIEGDLSAADEAAIFGFLADEGKKEWNYTFIHPYVFHMVTALARRILAGRFASLESDEAQRFLKRNGAYNDGKNGINRRRILHVNELRYLYEKFLANDEMMSLLKKMMEQNLLYRTKEVQIVMDYLRHFTKRHGMSRSDPGFALNRAQVFLKGEISSFDDPVNIEFLKDSSKSTVWPSVTFEGDSNV
jgi:hypothetical protein